VHPKFPDGGKLTQYLENLPIGEAVDVRGKNALVQFIHFNYLISSKYFFCFTIGPSGLLIYETPGVVSIKPDKKSPASNVPFKKLNMIAGNNLRMHCTVFQYLNVLDLLIWIGGTGITPMVTICFKFMLIKKKLLI